MNKGDKSQKPDDSAWPRDPVAAAVMRAIDELPLQECALLKFRYGLGMRPRDEEEVAEILEISLTDMWWTEAAALEQLGLLLLTGAIVTAALESLPR
jgi:DNA-directed RNA polymerase specialized sigma24 family protein